ncbi:acyl-CoA carboxylase subunit epsilon [uncultured Amnibacterium sp.]|uniref:acyl-CoA carboxylase subunit epsilon n=1 Tax=uncultured Amnibacterium sp. TaxID=1631851 RepID=UPI0035CA05DA
MTADLPQVFGGSPTDDELAAVAAVFATLALERAASNRRMSPAPRPPTWNRRTDVLRDPRPRDGNWTDLTT